MLKKIGMFLMTLIVIIAANTLAYAEEPDHLILIGDSRTEGMSEAVGSSFENTVNHWCFESGKGLKHMTDISFPFIDRTVAEIRAADPDAEINIICMYGVNDPHNVGEYAAYCNAKAAEMKEKNIRFFFVSVNPIADEKSNYRYDKDRYVTDFNTAVRPMLSEDITYIDTYSEIVGIFRPYTRDGVHYKYDLYREIYWMIRNRIRKG